MEDAILRNETHELPPCPVPSVLRAPVCSLVVLNNVAVSVEVGIG